MAEKLQILQMFDFYRSASEAQRRAILRAGRRVGLPKGAYYFREGSACGNVALVGSGRLRVFKLNPEGREVTLYRAGPGETCLLTIHSALTKAPYAASAITETPVEAVLLPVELFRAWVDTVPAVRNFALSTMAWRMVDLMTLVQETVFRRLDQRLAEYLLRRFDGEPEGTKTLTSTHAAIASDLGTAREVVSRLLEELERAGAVALKRGRIHLASAQALRRLAAQ